jgi:hypothetical protein
MSKADHERNVFQEFVELARLPIDAGSIRSEEPPLPDISCSIAGQRRFFELTRAVDQGIANDMGCLFVNAHKTGVGGIVPAHSYDDCAILGEAVERKADVAHKTDGNPLDLLVYYDGVFHTLTSFDLIEPLFRALQAKYRTRWRAIWLYDRNRKTVLS